MCAGVEGRRFAWALIVCLCVSGIALWWRLPAAEPEWEFVLCENDSLFQLHRVQRCLEEYPRVPSIDAYSHYPEGYRVHWINTLSLFYATAARLAGVDGRDLAGLGAALSWLPPLLGVLAVWLAWATARCLTGEPWCPAAAAVLAAVSADACRPFFFGAIDHHLFAHVGVMLLVLGRLRRRLWLWAAGLMSLFAMTPEAVLYVTAIFCCLLAADLAAIALGSDGRRVGVSWYLLPAVVCALAWMAHRSLDTAPLPVFAVSWVYFSVFHVVWFALLGGSFAAALWLLRRRARERGGPVQPIAVAAAAAVGVAVCVAWLGATGSLGTVVERFAVSGRIFVGEESSVFRAGLWRAPAWYRILAACGVFLLVKLAQSWRVRADADVWFPWLSLTAALALGLVEIRHTYVLSSLHVVAFAVTAFAVARLLRRLPVFSGAVMRAVPAALIAMVTALGFFGDVIDRAATHGDACARLDIARQLSEELRARTPAPSARDEERPEYGVFAPWSIGHQVHVLGRRPVVVDPFNYATDDGVESVLADVWLAQSVEELIGSLRTRNARYLVLTNPVEEIVGVLPRRGLERSDYVRYGPGGTFTFLPAMNAFAAFRLFMTAGQSAEFAALRREFFTADSEVYTARGDDGVSRRVAIPKGQIYELPGFRPLPE